MAQSENGDWLLLEDGNWIAAYQVSTQRFDGANAVRVQGESSVRSSVKDLEKGEDSGLIHGNVGPAPAGL